MIWADAVTASPRGALRRIAGWIEKTLGLTDTLGDSLIFAFQAASCSVATLWLAMWLQFSSPYWAASTVLITAQATRSQSLLKAVNRILGTLVGIGASIVIVGLFPQHWWSFALALSVWVAACTFVACLLRDLQAYAAALSGYTALIVLTESFGAPGDAFTVAVNRGSAVVLGVAMYSVTALLLIPARSSVKLREAFEDMFAKVRGVGAAVLRGAAGPKDCAALMARFPGFDQQIEEAATDGLWPPGTKSQMRRAVLALADLLVLASETHTADADTRDRAQAADQLDETTGTHDVDDSLDRLERHAAELARGPDEAGRRSAAATLAAMAQARAGLELLRTGAAPRTLGHVRRTVHRDYVAAGYAALRAFLGMMAAFTFWIETRWSQGSSFQLIVGIMTCLFATRPAPVTLGLRFTIGTVITAALSLWLGFFVIPRLGTFAGLGATLFPFMFVGTFGLKSKILAPYCTPVNFFLVAMIGLQNQMTYDPPGFFNSTFAIVCGCCVGVVIFELLPPPSDRVQGAILRWWIGMEATRRGPSRADRRAEWRLRLYDRLGTLIGKLPEAERGPAFAATRPVAVRLQPPS